MPAGHNADDFRAVVPDAFDMSRATVYVLLPLAFAAALVFVSEGVV